MTSLIAQAASTPTLRQLRGKMNGLEKIEDPFSRQKRWKMMKRDMPAVEKRMEKDRRHHQLGLERKWQRLVELQEEVQQLQGALLALEAGERKPETDQSALVLEFCEDQSARIEAQLSQLHKRRDRLKAQGYRRQLGEVELLISRLELLNRCTKDIESTVQAQPEAAPRLAIEAELQTALNRLTNVEMGLTKARRRTQRSEKDARLWQQFQQDLWFERMHQLNVMLGEEHQPPFIRSVRYVQDDERLCYASSWVDNSGITVGDGWQGLQARMEILKDYRLAILHEWRIAHEEEYEATKAYHAMEQRFPDRRLFELLTRIGLEATLPTFVGSPGIGRNLLLQWRTLEIGTQVQYDLRRLPGSLLRSRTSPNAEIELFNLSPRRNAAVLPLRDPLMDYWLPLSTHQLIANLRPQLEKWARAEMHQVQRGLELRQAYRIEDEFKRFEQQYRRAAEARVARIDLLRRVTPYRLDRFLMQELQQVSPDQFIEAASVEMKLILASLRRALVEEKWRRLHHTIKVVAEQEIPSYLQQLTEQWTQARRLEIKLTDPEPCLQDVPGKLELQFNRPVKLEGISVGGQALSFPKNKEQDQYQLTVPAKAKLLPVFNLNVKARLKKRMLPTHKLDADPSTRTVPVLQPDGTVLWKNYETPE